MLVTQAQLERHLQITFGNGSDPVVAEYLAQAQAAAEVWCQQPLEYTAGITESFQGEQRFQTWHRLKRFPVTALPSIIEDTITLTDVTDFEWYESGQLWRVVGDSDAYWSTRPRGVAVTYNAGYGTGAPAPYLTTPEDLMLGIVVYAAELFRHGATFAAHGAVPVTSVTLDGSDTIQYAKPATAPTESPLLGARSKQLLAKYSRRAM